MKPRAFLLIVIAGLFLAAGCTERQSISHWKSDLVGLKRTVTLYANNGQVIKSWKGRFKVEVSRGTARFLNDGRAIIISGTYIIEEDQ